MIGLYLLLSYLIGTIMFGFIVIKALHNEDIRKQGSGNVGARNAGRYHGKKAFIVIFLGDALKGVVVVIGAEILHFPDYIQLLGLGAAIIGHIKPIAMGFRGGKGISTFIGGIIAFDPLIVPVIILGFLILYPFTKSFTFSGLGAFLLIPIFYIYRDYDWISCVMISGIILIILLAHMENIRERLDKFGRKA
jgi:acyl phosphate:glycerol-3-phosphate acyltransferase